MATPRGKDRNATCLYYNSAKGCWFGDNCFYRHVDGDESNCRFYRTPKGCRFGERCMYKHDQSGTSSLGSAGTGDTSYLDSSYSSPYASYTSASQRQYFFMSSDDSWYASMEDESSPASSSDGAASVSKDLKGADSARLKTSGQKDISGAFKGLKLTSTPYVAEDEEDDEDSESEQKKPKRHCCACGCNSRCYSCVCARTGCTYCRAGNCHFDLETGVTNPYKRGFPNLSREKPTSMECHWCEVVVKDEEDILTAARKHYREELLKLNPKHLSLFNGNNSFDEHSLFCGNCSQTFKTIVDFLSHVKSKIEDEEKPEDQKMYSDIMDAIVHSFVEDNIDDIGYDDLSLRMGLMLSTRYPYDDDPSTDFLQRLKDINRLDRIEMMDEMDRRIGDEEDEDDDDDDEWYDVSDEDEDDECGDGICAISFMAFASLYQNGNHSPTEEDIEELQQDMEYELLCQGIKPWDPEAGAALDVLYGGYDDFDF